MTRSVVVGVDASPSGWKAVRTAAHEAGLRGVDLRLVHAFGRPVPHVPPGGQPWNPGGTGMRELVDGTMAEAERLVHRVAPQVGTARHVTVGEPLMVLGIASRTASLVVVGHRGLGAFGGLLLGSTTGHLAAHARCPVLIVRGRDEPDGPVLPAVDEAPACGEAVRFAFAEASLRHADLPAVHVSGEGEADAHDGPADPPSVTRDGRRPCARSTCSTPRRPVPSAGVRRCPCAARRSQAACAALSSTRTRTRTLSSWSWGRGAGVVSQACSWGRPVRPLLHHAQCPLVVARHEGAGWTRRGSGSCPPRSGQRMSQGVEGTGPP